MYVNDKLEELTKKCKDSDEYFLNSLEIKKDYIINGQWDMLARGLYRLLQMIDAEKQTDSILPEDVFVGYVKHEDGIEKFNITMVFKRAKNGINKV